MRHAQPLVFSSSSSSCTTKALPEPPAPSPTHRCPLGAAAALPGGSTAPRVMGWGWVGAPREARAAALYLRSLKMGQSIFLQPRGRSRWKSPSQKARASSRPAPTLRIPSKPPGWHRGVGYGAQKPRRWKGKTQTAPRGFGFVGLGLGARFGHRRGEGVSMDPCPQGCWRKGCSQK